MRPGAARQRRSRAKSQIGLIFRSEAGKMRVVRANSNERAAVTPRNCPSAALNRFSQLNEVSEVAKRDTGIAGAVDGDGREWTIMRRPKPSTSAPNNISASASHSRLPRETSIVFKKRADAARLRPAQ